jgi:hypothetical protein
LVIGHFAALSLVIGHFAALSLVIGAGRFCRADRYTPCPSREGDYHLSYTKGGKGVIYMNGRFYNPTFGFIFK